jgi:alpha-galactosidase|tara:strand:+ start:434 stop:910 length:477 start_codon:yes stop_codon:yes gene_type:complete
MPTQSKYDREMATIKADVAAMGSLWNKLDDAIEKIGTASANISSILAVHEERIDMTEKLVTERRRESSEAVKELHSRISTASRERMEEHKAVQQDMKQSEEKILNAINELRKDVNKEQQHLEDRITKLEQWRWILIGVLIAVSAVVPNMGKIVSMLSS